MDEETRAIFQAETESLVDSLEERLLALRDTPLDQGLIDAVFRDLHTLKGTGAMFGREDIACFLHDFETVFEAVRAGEVQADTQLITISLEARDHVVALLAEKEVGSGQQILDQLALHLKGEQKPAAYWLIRFALPPETLILGGRPEIILDDLRALGATRISADTSALPPLAELDPSHLYLTWEAEIGSQVSEEAIREVFLFYDDRLEITLTQNNDASAAELMAETPHIDPTSLPQHDTIPTAKDQVEQTAPNRLLK